MEAARGFMSDLGGALNVHLLDTSETPHIELQLSIPKAHVPVTKETWPESRSA